MNCRYFNLLLSQGVQKTPVIYFFSKSSTKLIFIWKNFMNIFSKKSNLSEFFLFKFFIQIFYSNVKF